MRILTELLTKSTQHMITAYLPYYCRMIWKQDLRNQHICAITISKYALLSEINVKKPWPETTITSLSFNMEISDQTIMTIVLPNLRVLNQVTGYNKTELQQLIPNILRIILITAAVPTQIARKSLGRNNTVPDLSPVAAKRRTDQRVKESAVLIDL